MVSGAIGALYVYMFVVGMAPGNTDIISTSSQQPDESKQQQQQQQQQLEMQDLKIWSGQKILFIFHYLYINIYRYIASLCVTLSLDR